MNKAKNKKLPAAGKRARILSGVRRPQMAQPVKTRFVPLGKNIAVLGAGAAGLQAAATLADLGYRVALLHHGQEPGGVTAATPELFGYIGANPAESSAMVKTLVENLVAKVRQNKNVSVYSNVRVKSVQGEAGSFSVTAVTAAGDNPGSAKGPALSEASPKASFAEARILKASAVVIASGCACAPDLKISGEKNACVVGLDDLLQRIRAGAKLPAKIALVMDAASEQGRAVFAQVLSIAELIAGRANVQVKLFCRHARVAATGMEALYRRARQAGLVVVKGDKPPVVTLNGATALLRWHDEVLNCELSEEFDLVVMADLLPGPGVGAMNSGIVAGLRPGPEGAAQYDNVRLLPVSTNRPGIFVAGSARSNSELRDALADGLAAAAQVHALLGPGRMPVRDDTAQVEAEKCVLCLTCVRICPHGAPSVDAEKKSASISAISCQRCGACAAECPACAITLPGYTDEQFAAEVGEQPHVVVFACENSALPAAEAAGAAGMEIKNSVQLIRVPCAGDVSPRTVLSALEKGARKVVVMGCHPESCLYLSGAGRASERMERMRGMLAKAGIDQSRVSFVGMAPVESIKFMEYVKEQI